MESNQKNSTKTKPQWEIFFFIMVIFFVALYVQNSRKSSLINECPRYTIAYSTKIFNKKVYYRYSIMGRNFTDFWRINPRSVRDVFNLYKYNFISQRFLLRVNCEKPDVNEIDWTRSIPESVRSAPEEGWKIVPEEFPKTEFAD